MLINQCGSGCMDKHAPTSSVSGVDKIKKYQKNAKRSQNLPVPTPNN